MGVTDAVTPILVSDRSGLTEATKEYMVKEKMNNLELVGGEDVLTANVKNQLDAMQPTVLATKTVTEKQEKALTEIKQGTVDKTTLIQVGDGVLKTVMNKIAELIK